MVDTFTAATGTSPALASVAPIEAEPDALRLGSFGDEVKMLQSQLNARGELLPVNGRFGPRTLEAVRRFQLASGIQPATGVAGWSTLRALAQREQKTLWGATVRDLGPDPTGQTARPTDWFANATAQRGVRMQDIQAVKDNVDGS